MYYHTPKVNRYVTLIQKYRLAIILAYILMTLGTLFFYQPKFVSSDTSFWLNESQEMKRTQAQAYDANYIGQLELKIGEFNDATKTKLNTFQHTLEKLPGISHIDSLCGAYRIYTDGDEVDSSLVKATPLGIMDAKELEKFVKAYGQEYDEFVNDDFTEVSYFIYSSEPIDISSIDVPFSYSYSEPNAKADLNDYLLSVLAVIFSIMLFFRLVFHNYISAIAGLFVIAITMVGTFSFVYLFTGDNHVHIAMTLIVVSIALIDYLYFYYRWHVSQYKADVSRATLKTINRNIHPAFWTSLLTLIGLGPLLIVDSIIIQQLSLSVILASGFAYLLNLTLLPALVSYFTVEHPKVEFARFCYIFANKEMHYNKKFLGLFLAATTIVMVIGAYQLFFAQEKMFANNVTKDVISISVPYNEVDETLLLNIEAFENRLKAENSGVKEVNSLLTIMELFNKANAQEDIYSEQNYMQALFFLELYGLEKNIMNEDTLFIRVTIEDTDKNGVIHWLQHYKDMPIYFTDIDSIIGTAKLDKLMTLGVSLGTALVIIGLIMGWIFRSREMVFVGFFVNAIPIIWFGLFLNLFNVPLSLEVLIAMTITVGLASDATVHFGFKYYRSRFYGRTEKHALEVMFFYAGVPVIIGAIVLMAVFALLTLTDVPSLQLIGAYGAILMLLSLLTDLLILPVLLLAIDKFNLNQTKKKKIDPRKTFNLDV